MRKLILILMVLTLSIGVQAQSNFTRDNVSYTIVKKKGKRNKKATNRSKFVIKAKRNRKPAKMRRRSAGCYR